jgi:signal transduction histidine kinase/AraC-like DNA-binding protein/ABC-type sugar transport system substrate-binding protein
VSHILRIGARIGSADPFWVQVREAVYQLTQQSRFKLVQIDTGSSAQTRDELRLDLLDELLAQDIDVLITAYLPDTLAYQVLEVGLPIIHLTESSVRHPLFVSPSGFFEISQQVGSYLAEQLNGRGHIVVIGGLMADRGEDGRSRIAGFNEALKRYPGIRTSHIPSLWRYEHAYPQVLEKLAAMSEPIDAIFGLSDSLALVGRDVGRELGKLTDSTVIMGINGDPSALAAIANGSMAATIETAAADFATQALELAERAASGQALPSHFSYKPRLVTKENVADVALQTLSSIAGIPNRLVGVNRREEQQRLTQLETSLEISRLVGSTLDPYQLSNQVVDLIRSNYGYDQALFYLWDSEKRVLRQDTSNGEVGRELQLHQAGLLAEVIEHNKLIYIPDSQHSHRYAPEIDLGLVHSRVAIPIRFGNRLLAILDMHSSHIIQHINQDLVGLQSLADQLGVAMRNAELYSEAVRARAAAEKADQLKTRLLANVSHEFRSPLNVIVSYAQALLEPEKFYKTDLPAQAIQDVHHIQKSAQHLVRLIDDLLDLSRAEIDALNLEIEPISPRPFFEEIFRSWADRIASNSGVQWRLQLPPRLPVIQIDPVRMRQILLNLLSNASKFTSRGSVTLGAEVVPPYVHIWVEDTGIGVVPELQERIFEPFVTGGAGRREGIGLGLGITRRLVALHGGHMALESTPGQGSTFHVYLPLPNLQGNVVNTPEISRSVLVVLANGPELPAAISELGRRQGLTICRLQPEDDIQTLFASLRPAAIAWDLAQASNEHWSIVQKIRSFPQWAQLPMILYNQDEDPGTTALTSFVLKPLEREALQEALLVLRPTSMVGPVLIVDDDPQICLIYERLVSEALPNYPIRVAHGGSAALAILAQEVPSLVILDLQMPDVHGFTVIDQLRAYEPTRDVPILVVTGQLLSLDDIVRLNYNGVTLHTKGILTDEEQVLLVQQACNGRSPLSRQTSALVRRAVVYIQQHYSRPLSRQEIAEVVGLSKNYLSQIFHQELGISPWEYLNRYRIRQARELLRTTNDSITTIASLVGFDDPAYFSRIFRNHTGLSPRAYREESSVLLSKRI